MTRLEILRQRLATKQSEWRKAIAQGKGHKLFKLQQDIKLIEDNIAEAEQYEPKRLSEILDRETLKSERLAERIIKMHIASDYLADCAVDLKQALRRLGLETCSLFPLTDEIRALSERFASLVCDERFGGLMNFMLENEALIKDMHLIVNRFMNEHLAIKD